MLWFFEREDESLHVETRYDNATCEFVAIVRYPDSREHIERFTDIAAFRSWLGAFKHVLEAEYWIGRQDGPVILPDGWPDKRLE